GCVRPHPRGHPGGAFSSRVRAAGIRAVSRLFLLSGRLLVLWSVSFRVLNQGNPDLIGENRFAVNQPNVSSNWPRLRSMSCTHLVCPIPHRAISNYVRKRWANLAPLDQRRVRCWDSSRLTVPAAYQCTRTRCVRLPVGARCFGGE